VIGIPELFIALFHVCPAARLAICCTPLAQLRPRSRRAEPRSLAEVAAYLINRDLNLIVQCLDTLVVPGLWMAACRRNAAP
jgi:hypothetical protein